MTDSDWKAQRAETDFLNDKAMQELQEQLDIANDRIAYLNQCQHEAGVENANLREMLSASARDINRLEEAGEMLCDCADQIGWTSSESPKWIKKAEDAVKAWKNAKIPETIKSNPTIE